MAHSSAQTAVDSSGILGETFAALVVTELGGLATASMARQGYVQARPVSVEGACRAGKESVADALDLLDPVVQEGLPSSRQAP